MTFNIKVRLFQLFVQLMGVYSMYYVLHTGEYHWLLVTLIAYIIIGPISIGLTLHRLLTHRSFVTYKWLENVLSFLTVYCTLGPSVTWVGLHRYHHTHADTDQDPHTPNRGALGAWIGYNWYIPQIPMQYVKDLLRKPLHKFMANHYFKILIISILLLALVNPVLTLFVYFLPTALAFHGVNMINVFGHGHGYRNFNTDDVSTNSWITHILTWEGLHNNHHEMPGAWNLRIKPWELDPLSWIIRLIRIKQ